MAGVDVIIPVYNQERYIVAALDSVLAQTHTDWTMIVVDDGSTDGSAAVLDRYADRCGPKLRIIRQSNRGLPAARNTAINNSSAEFIATLDSDDVWLPNRLEEGLRAITRSKTIGLVHSKVALIDENGDVIGYPDFTGSSIQGFIAPDIYQRRVTLLCPTVLFRRSCVNKTGLFDESLKACEDRDLWLRIAEHCEVAFVDKVLAYYRRHSASITANKTKLREAQINFLAKHYGRPGCGWRAHRTGLGSVYFEQGTHKLAAGESGALLDLLHAFWYRPLYSRNVRILAKWALLTAFRPNQGMRPCSQQRQ